MDRPEGIVHELTECLACQGPVEHDEGTGIWRCTECASTVTQEGVEALAGDPNGEGPIGPLDLI